MVENPRYTHECKECTYLGRYAQYDLYVHGKGDNPELVVRYSDAPDGYSCDDALGIRPGIHENAKIETYILALKEGSLYAHDLRRLLKNQNK